jgi:hypothetical protein
VETLRTTTGEVFGEWFDASALAELERLVQAGRDARPTRIVAWSGTMGEGAFEADVRTWGPRGWERLNLACERLAAAGMGGQAVCFRPHAAHVLSDIPSCAKFLKEWGERGFEVAPDPVMMMTEEMVRGGRAEDFVRRVLEWAAGQERPGIPAVFLTQTAAFGGAVVERLASEVLPAHVARIHGWPQF